MADEKKPKRKHKKNTEKSFVTAQRKARMIEVEKLMIVGMKPRQIHTAIGAKHNVGLRMIRMDVEKVQEEWREHANVNRDLAFSETRELLNYVIQKGFSLKNLSAVNQAIRLRAELDGLTELKLRHLGEITHKVDQVEKMTSAQQRKMVNELFQVATGIETEEPKPN